MNSQAARSHTVTAVPEKALENSTSTSPWRKKAMTGTKTQRRPAEPGETRKRSKARRASRSCRSPCVYWQRWTSFLRTVPGSASDCVVLNSIR